MLPPYFIYVAVFYGRKKKCTYSAYINANSKCDDLGKWNAKGDDFMAQRTVALCDGKCIGIETIYAVINGQQINIPDRLKSLRIRSQNNELFCPCGCGTNLILVAGDKRLREQHFREKAGTAKGVCTMPREGKTSIDSKIVLKCWLDDKLQVADIESRVALATIEDTRRKVELSFLSMTKKIGIRYWKRRSDILDDKIDAFAENLPSVKIYYIVDSSNGGTKGQYPEALMKIQNKQQYCLMLEIHGSEYGKAKMRALFYEKTIIGLWTENIFVDGKLSEYNFSESGTLLYGESEIETLLQQARKKFVDEKQSKIEQAAKIGKVSCEKEIKTQEETIRADGELNESVNILFEQQEKQVRDTEGRRWLKCEFCGKIASEDEFDSFGGRNHINLGTCRDCSKNNPQARESITSVTFENTYNSMKCPKCGGNLIERSGIYGNFYGCANFPKCNYTQRIKRKIIQRNT